MGQFLMDTAKALAAKGGKPSQASSAGSGIAIPASAGAAPAPVAPPQETDLRNRLSNQRTHSQTGVNFR